MNGRDPVIAGQGRSVYRAAMHSILLRLLALLAIALMPVGMTGAAAAAGPAATAMTSTHCTGQEDQEQAPSGQMDAQCMACAGLPAAAAQQSAKRLLPGAPRSIALAFAGPGIVAEIATPPPKSH